MADVSIADDVKLITEIKNKPILWDARLPEYRNNKKGQESAFVNIASKLGKEGKFLRFTDMKCMSSRSCQKCDLSRSTV